MKAAVLFIEGTNCEDESLGALEKFGFNAETVHLKQFYGDCKRGLERNLLDYDLIYLPGGWSSGDYVRAGAVFAARMKSRIGDQVTEYLDQGKHMLGVCNGFQVLVEYGILPGFDGVSDNPKAVLTINNPPKFQCRPTYIKHHNPCQLTETLETGTVLQVPIAHAEGRFTFGEKSAELLAELQRNKQIVFTYCQENGEEARGYPENPNGSLADIAGITNPQGNVLGMMPHPERVIHANRMADWTRKKYSQGDGAQIFQSIREKIQKNKTRLAES